MERAERPRESWRAIGDADGWPVRPEDADKLRALIDTIGRVEDGTYWLCSRCGALLGVDVIGEPRSHS